MSETNGTKIILCKILKEIQAGDNISYGEILFLQEHRAEIKKYFAGEPQLWEWAGIPESVYNGEYDIIKHETRDYYYIYETKTNTELCDAGGEPFHFETEADAYEYLNQQEL